jgi:uncharacterized membrane protein YkvA (DUF1232 family)
MARKSTGGKSRPPAVKKKRSATARRQPLLERSDIRLIVYELANRVAPADVTALLQAERDLRQRATRLQADNLHLLAEQLSLALDCLRDHVDGACPQIPYYTISLLAAAVSYFADELDVIPDFLPRVGRLDDAVVMAMAYELGRDGLRRYCAWKGRDAHTVLPAGGTPAPS